MRRLIGAAPVSYTHLCVVRTTECGKKVVLVVVAKDVLPLFLAFF